MMTVTIKIENSNLDKAKVEVEALLVYISELAKTYETTFKEPIAEPVVEKKTRKPRAKKTETAPEEVKPVKEVSEPVEEEKTVTEPSTDSINLKALTDLARTVAQTSKEKREETKKLIGEYSTSGKLSSVPAEKYDELAEALKGL